MPLYYYFAKKTVAFSWAALLYIWLIYEKVCSHKCLKFWPRNGVHSVQIVTALCKRSLREGSQRKTHIWCRRLRGSSGDKWVWESASPKTSHPKDIFQCKVFFFSKIFPFSPEIVFAVAAGPIGHPGAVGVPKKAVFMTPNWLFTGKSVILIFEILSVDFWAVWNVWTAAKISLSWESLKQSRHFYSCHIHAKLECLFTWWFAFRRYCTSFGGNSQRYKLRILWSLSKTFNRRISNDMTGDILSIGKYESLTVNVTFN